MRGMFGDRIAWQMGRGTR